MKRRPGETAFTLICTVEEGMACRFAAGPWDDAWLELLIPALITELGWKNIEHSARREVVIRCTAPGNDPARAICEIDRGAGFAPLAIFDP
jgi:hypothetical protein